MAMKGHSAASALVTLEWGLLIGRRDEGRMIVGTCPACGTLEALGEHGPRCVLDAGLVELGLPTQIERDELRAKIERSEESTQTDLKTLVESEDEDAG